MPDETLAGESSLGGVEIGVDIRVPSDVFAVIYALTMVRNEAVLPGSTPIGTTL
jgi:hypothetical protein